MITFEEIKKIFEYKPDLYQFLNSPLFFLIVAIVLVIFLIIAWRVLRKPKKEKKKKLHIKRKEEGEEAISEDTAKAQTDFYEKQMNAEKEVEESSDYEEPVVPETTVNEKEMVILGEKEIIILNRDSLSVTVLFNNNGKPEVKMFNLFGEEAKKLKDLGITLEPKKPVYIPYVPEAKHAIPLEKSKSDETATKIVRYSPGELGDVEREVDELTAVKKKPKFLSRFAILMEEMEMRKKKEVETAKEQTTETSSTRQPTEKEVFEDDIPEDKEPERQETKVEPPKEDTQPTQQEGESIRQKVMKLLEQGKTREDVITLTGYADRTIARYVNDWTDSQLRIAKKFIEDGRWNLIKKISEVIDKKETFLVEDGELYYPGRDRLTYVFLVTTIILACIAVVEIFVL